MANYFGALGWIGFKKETTPGTAQTTTSQFLQAESFLLSQEHNLIDLKSNFGSIGDMPNLAGTLKPTGKATGVPLAASLPHPFYWVLGSVTVVGTSAPYTHTITPSVDLPSLTVEGNEVAINMKQAGAQINKLTLKCAAGEVGKLDIEWLGLTHNTNVTLTSTPVYVTDFLTFVGATVSIAGTAALDVQNIELSIENGLEAQFVINNTRYPASIVRKSKPKISGKITFIDYPTTLYNTFMNAATFALSLNFTSSNGNSIQINMPAAQVVKGFETEIKAEHVTAETDFNIFQDPTTSKIITVTAINSVPDLTV